MFVSMAAMDFLFPWVHILKTDFLPSLDLDRTCQGFKGLRLGSDYQHTIGCDTPVEFCASLKPHSLSNFLRYGGLSFAGKGRVGHFNSLLY
jgi:hypothetical protein